MLYGIAAYGLAVIFAIAILGVFVISIHMLVCGIREREWPNIVMGSTLLLMYFFGAVIICNS